MLTPLRNDIRYFLYSKLWILMTALFLLTALFICNTNHQNARANVINYQLSVEQAEKSGENAAALQAADYTILSSDKNSGVVENPIAYYYAEIEKSITYLQPNRLIVPLFAGELAFIPILSAFFGLIWVSVDHKYHTLRYRSLRFGKQSSLFSRQISGYLLLIILMVITSLSTFGIQAYFTHAFYTEFPEISNIPYCTDHFSPAFYLKCIPFILFLLLLYYELGFFVGNLFKQNPISYALVGAYILFVPPLFRYDIANITCNIARLIFPYNGAFTLQGGSSAKLIPSIFVLISLLLAFIILNAVITQKRSAY